MAKRMLIDATQGEETRVAVIDGNRLDELDFEIASRKQLKGNIYLAKVTRVEPSLQAAFVEYGGNRQGFLAFAEIHPDYYKIPVADREKLLELEREEAEREAAEEEEALAAAALGEAAALPQSDLPPEALQAASPVSDLLSPTSDELASTPLEEPTRPLTIDVPPTITEPMSFDIPSAEAGSSEVALTDSETPSDETDTPELSAEGEVIPPAPAHSEEQAEEGEEDADRRKRARRRTAILRQYKIQEVIKRNQILLIQVVKEERGNKGAALTTYLSLAGRYCVLMPNTNRGGGVSRKINSLEERRRMKSLLAELDLPQGMSIILRTAGLERSKVDIKRDLDYLTRLWDSIREKTLSSTAPSLIHEEANLIRRAIRDLYSRDVTEVHVEGDEGYRMAKDFMRMMVPSAARRVHHYRDPAVPLFVRYRVESQIESLYSTTVGLKSGGYLVINQTEALVAIDVNSGRSTRERNIEETALRTNLEAAEEVGRQVRLRDLAGLLVIDFIDMEDSRHNAQVERRIREAMKNDRARIQIGRISMFGLLELSRQRLRPSLIESNFSVCPACGGIGHVRSVESAALHVLRSVEEEGLQQKASELAVNVSEAVALYLLNHKRAALSDVESRYGIKVFIHSDTTIVKNAEHKIERLKARLPGEFTFPEPPPPVIEEEPPLPEGMEDEELLDAPLSSEGFDSETGEAGTTEEGDERRSSEGRNGRRSRGGRNRNRSGNGRGDRPAYPDVAQPGAPQPDVNLPLLGPDGSELVPVAEGEAGYVALSGHGQDGETQGIPSQPGDEPRRGRRRGRRGGRGRFRGDRNEANNGEAAAPQLDAEGNPLPPAPEGERPEGARDGNRGRGRFDRNRGPRLDADGNPLPPAPEGERPPRGEHRGRGGRGRFDRNRGPREGGENGYPPREPRFNPAQSTGGEGGGVKIISEFRGRNDPAPARPAPAAPTPQAAPVASTAPASDKPKSGWWKRLIGTAE